MKGCATLPDGAGLLIQYLTRIGIRTQECVLPMPEVALPLIFHPIYTHGNKSKLSGTPLPVKKAMLP
jgi:hypothetical protein